MIVIKHGRLFFKNSSFFKKLQCGILSGPETGRSFRATFWFVFTKPRPTASGRMVQIIRRYDRPALLDRGTLEVDARVEEGVVHPRDGAAVGVAVQLLVALAALKTECDANLS